MRLILAAAIALTASAAQADTTTLPFHVAPGKCAQSIGVPINNKPVIVVVADVQNGDPGTGMVSLVRDTRSTSPFLLWAGTDFENGVERGLASTGGIPIMYVDAGGLVSLQSASSAHIRVCNSSSNGSNAVGYLTFTY